MKPEINQTSLESRARSVHPSRDKHPARCALTPGARAGSTVILQQVGMVTCQETPAGPSSLPRVRAGAAGLRWARAPHQPHWKTKGLPVVPRGQEHGPREMPRGKTERKRERNGRSLDVVSQVQISQDAQSGEAPEEAAGRDLTPPLRKAVCLRVEVTGGASVESRSQTSATGARRETVRGRTKAVVQCLDICDT